MKVLSLFDGISCGMLALQRAGIPVECYDAFEIDKYAVTVSKRNFPVIVHHGNVYDGDLRSFRGMTFCSAVRPAPTGQSPKRTERLTATARDSGSLRRM